MYRERKQLTEKEVKKIVQGYVQAATGSEISNDAIVTVCGKWALSARLLQCGYVDEYTKDEVEDGLKKAEVPRGQTEDLHQKAVILEGKTGIEELERRWAFLLPVWPFYYNSCIPHLQSSENDAEMCHYLDRHHDYKLSPLHQSWSWSTCCTI